VVESVAVAALKVFGKVIEVGGKIAFNILDARRKVIEVVGKVIWEGGKLAVKVLEEAGQVVDIAS